MYLNSKSLPGRGPEGFFIYIIYMVPGLSDLAVAGQDILI